MLFQCILSGYFALNLSKPLQLCPLIPLGAFTGPSLSGFRAGLHDNVPNIPSAKVAPVGCQLATMALKIKTVTIPKSGFHGKGRHLILDVGASGLSCTRLSATLAVNRLGRCRAIRSRLLLSPTHAFITHVYITPKSYTNGLTLIITCSFNHVSCKSILNAYTAELLSFVNGFHLCWFHFDCRKEIVINYLKK